MKYHWALVATGLVAVATARAETFTYAVYEVAADSRVLLFEDSKQYSAGEVESDERVMIDEGVFWSKSLELKEGFRVGVHVVHQFNDDAFGIFVKRDSNPEGFSWEWFSHREGNTFERFSQAGRIRVRFEPIEGRLVEIASIEFLDDVTLGFEREPTKPPAATHLIVVKKGSILRLIP
jgi:hypothetical protein